ncbi:MAG: MFS transporter, partial [Actinomycetota bacterium]|nr:MFS transporter [Actinomycetota bacterium]
MAARDRLVTAPFALVTGAALAYFVAIGTLTPVLPLYVEGPLGGGDVAVGVSVGAFSLAAALLRPLIGRIGDQRGRRVLVIGGALIVGVSVAGYGLASSLPLLIAMRLLTGVGEAALFVGAATAIQDLAPDSRRGEAASYFSVAIYGGLALGPALGEWVLGEDRFASVWALAVASCVVAAVLAWWTPIGEIGAPSGPRRLLHPAALVPGSVLGLSLIGFAGFSTFVPLYVSDIGLGGSSQVFALYAGAVLAVRIFGARIPDVVGPVRTASTALVCLAAGLAIMAAWQVPLGLYVGTIVFAGGSSLLFPALNVLVIDAAPATERSAAVATFSIFFDLSQGVGALVLGVVVAGGGEPAAFAVGALLCIVALAVLRRQAPAHLARTAA